MPVEIVRTEHLGCSYSVGKVLEDITLTIEAGDYVGVVGPNGSGKSTFVKALLGLCDISDGKAFLFGKPSDKFDEWGRVGYLPQNMSLLNPVFPATVQETTELGLLSLKKFPRRFTRQDKEKVASVLDLLGVYDLRKKLIGELSGGQQQRALLARALVNDPQLLILDEPTAALDPETRERFYRLVSDVNRASGVTVLLVTHDTGVIGQHASKMLYLDKKLLFFGSFDQFCHSKEMSELFGHQSQHIICHRH